MARVMLHWAQKSKVEIMRSCSGGGCGKMPEVEGAVLIIAPSRSPLWLHLALLYCVEERQGVVYFNTSA